MEPNNIPIQGAQWAQVHFDPSKLRTREQVQEYIAKWQGHAVGVLNNLKEQNSSLANSSLATNSENINTIYSEAEKLIKNTVDQLHTEFEGSGKLSEKEISDLKKELKLAEKEIAKIISKAQLDVFSEVGKTVTEEYQNTFFTDKSDDQFKKIETEIESKVRTLAKGGRGGVLKIKFLALVSKTNEAAIHIFKKSKEKMEGAYEKRIAAASLIAETAIEINTLKPSKLNQKVGVVGIKGFFALKTFFSSSKIKKQLKEFRVQNINKGIREKIQKTLTIDTEPVGKANAPTKADNQQPKQPLKVTSNITPINKEFDVQVHQQVQNAQQVANKLLSTLLDTNESSELFDGQDNAQSVGVNAASPSEAPEIFGKIAGESGVSSLNRQLPHLVNGWYSNLTAVVDGEDVELLGGLRHGVASAARANASPAEQENLARNAAEELIQASLMQELADQGLTIEQASKLDEPIALTLNSVSLLTPQSLSGIGSKIAPKKSWREKALKTDEKRMLNDQMKAFDQSFKVTSQREMEKPQTIDRESLSNDVKKAEANEVSGTASLEGSSPDENIRFIKLGDHTIKVNLQINAFNFGVNAPAMGVAHLGTTNQYVHNLKAMEKLEKQYQEYANNLSNVFSEMNESLAISEKVDTPENTAKMQKLQKDYEKLMKLQNNCSLLIHDIRKLMESANAYQEGKNPYEIGAKILNLNHQMRLASKIMNKNTENKSSGTQCAYNCMSGKDRTGVMDCVAKTYALMANLNEEFPSHDDLTSKRELKEQFIALYAKFLEESGNLEVTGVNTGVIGLKISEEARLGMSKEEFERITGLSSLVES